jgi:hypothetical protein
MKTWVSVTFLRVFNLDTEGNRSIRLERLDEEETFALCTESNSDRPIPGITVTQLSRREDKEVQRMYYM